MAIKPTKVNVEVQVRPGNDGDVLAVEGVNPEWQTPSEAGLSTEAYAQERATEALEAANLYSDDRKQESLDYTNSQTVQTKFELQNYTDDEVAGLKGDLEGQLSDKADLVGGRVPASQLPGFAETFEVYPTDTDFPPLGDPVVLYIAEDTNKTYRWVAPNYVELLGHLELGETETTAYRGDRGRMAYDHTLAVNNPHSVNKTQVGLSEVDNTSDANKPVSTATQDALNLKANTVHTHAVTDVTGLQAQLDGKATSASLATVATTGSYDDLSDLPPSSTLTILSTTTISAAPEAYTQTNIQEQSTSLSINNSLTVPSDGTRYVFRLRGDGVSNHTISWGSTYRPMGMDLPMAFNGTKVVYVGMIYNADDNKWDVVAKVEED